MNPPVIDDDLNLRRYRHGDLTKAPTIYLSVEELSALADVANSLKESDERNGALGYVATLGTVYNLEDDGDGDHPTTMVINRDGEFWGVTITQGRYT